MTAFGLWHRDLDIILAGRIGNLTPEERRSLLPIVSCTVELALTSRKSSILELEKQRKQLADKDLSAGVLMLIDGTETDTVITWFRNRIVYSDIQGCDLLRLLLIATAVEAIGKAMEPHMIRSFLTSYLGENLISELELRHSA
jgi:hypothetical protein